MPDMFGRPTDKEIKRVGQANPYERYINVGSRQKGKPGNVGANRVPYRIENPYYQSPDALNKRQAEAEKRQAAFQQQLSAQAAATQADIAKQLQIVQQEKSAVAKMQEDYAAALKAEADAKRKAQEDAQIALTTAQANQARAGRQANLQIQPAGQTPSTAGTQRFKLRGQFSKARQALTSGLNIGQSNSLNLG